MSRALAHVEVIKDIQPIPNADAIDVATVLGWKVVVKKDEFNVGDKVIYIEIDSKVPEIPEFEFLRDRHFKVKTIKLRGQYSQGLIVPMSLLKKDYEIGADVTKELGITYYVPADNARKSDRVNPKLKYQSMCARHRKVFSNPIIKKFMRYEWFRKLMFLFFGKKKDKPTTFPTKFEFVHKTDEERIENLPHLLGFENPLIVTEKLDGTSCTYIMERLNNGKFEFWVTSRNVRQLNEDQECYHGSNIYWEMAKKYDIENKLRKYLEDNYYLDYVCIQGEAVGNVQGNPLKLSENDLYVFNFIESKLGRINSVTGRDIVEGELGMKWVPILSTNFMMPNTMEEFKLMADGKSVVNPKVDREGIVLRDPVTDLSFKNVSRKYLMKHQNDE